MRDGKQGRREVGDKEKQCYNSLSMGSTSSHFLININMLLQSFICVLESL